MMRPFHFSRSPQRHALGPVRVMCALAVIAVIAACERSDSATRTESEIKVSVAESFAEGMRYHEFWIQTTAPFDPFTQELRSLRLTGPDAMLHAERAEILIDVEREEMTLRLHDVIVASGDEESDSRVEKIETQTLDPVSIAGYLVR